MTTAAPTPSAARAPWPALPLDAWRETKDTLHLWTQIVGKIRLALAPMVNHWWQVPLYVNARGLTTSAMPYGGGAVEVRFDFLDDMLHVETSAGATRDLALEPRSVADFYHATMDALRALGVDIRIRPRPVELTDVIAFDRDEVHGAYDAEAARRFWRVLVQVDRVLHAFRGRFIGKCSPVHFFWGSFDLAVTRFSGRRAPERTGADAMTREAYSHEVISHGFWPGSGAVQEPAFYAYTAPEPQGLREARVQPAAAFYSTDFSEFILPYDAVRTAASPENELLAFLETTYASAADLAGWNRNDLERRHP